MRRNDLPGRPNPTALIAPCQADHADRGPEDVGQLRKLFQHAGPRLDPKRDRYRSKMHPVLKRNFEAFSACDWLAALMAHIPNAGEHLVRYYGWYSNVSRDKRRKAQGEDLTAIEEFSEISAPAAKRAWAHLIK